MGLGSGWAAVRVGAKVVVRARASPARARARAKVRYLHCHVRRHAAQPREVVTNPLQPAFQHLL
jgi:hypothetical protein